MYSFFCSKGILFLKNCPLSSLRFQHAITCLSLVLLFKANLFISGVKDSTMSFNLTRRRPINLTSVIMIDYDSSQTVVSLCQHKKDKERIFRKIGNFKEPSENLERVVDLHKMGNGTWTSSCLVLFCSST